MGKTKVDDVQASLFDVIDAQSDDAGGTGAEGLNKQAHKFAAQGNLQSAVDAALEAVKIAPDYAESYFNLGVFCSKAGQWQMAIEYFGHAVLKDKNNTAYKQSFAKSLRHFHIKVFSPTLQQILILCLRDEHLDHRLLAPTWHRMYSLDPAFAPLREAAGTKEFSKFAIKATLDQWGSLFHNEYLIEGLRHLVVPSADFEREMTFLRRKFLADLVNSNAEALPNSALTFLCALAEYCWHTEYALCVSDLEQRQVNQVMKALRSEKREPRQMISAVAILACYQSLGTFEGIETALEMALAKGGEDVESLLQSQIIDLQEEVRIGSEMHMLEDILDETSIGVRGQYEENPYPRWRVTDMASKPFPCDINILVAGCGTGKQSASLASLYPHAKIINVDLSLASLSYAARKAKELALDNLSFIQADILSLEKLNQKFDLIYCTGVIHHMNEPKAGLAVLKKLLAPKGRMVLSLYSEMGRSDIVKVHRYIESKAKSYPANELGIRKFRERVLKGVDEKLMSCLQRLDFYRMSTCRDMYFHVQEHRFTLPQIEAMLTDHDMAFLDFYKYDQRVLRSFQSRFIEENARFDLKKWDRFERENPSVFANMYSMWICNKDDANELKFKNNLHHFS